MSKKNNATNSNQKRKDQIADVPNPPVPNRAHTPLSQTEKNEVKNKKESK